MAVGESVGPRAPYSHPWLAEAVFALDERLRRRHRVLEYSTHPTCIFRLDIAFASRARVLPDGTSVRAGERIARLHFWNEHVPPLPRNGAAIAWAHMMQQAIALSLRELARYLRSRPDLSDVRIISGDVPCGTKTQSAQLARIMAYYGFQAVAEPRTLSTGERARRFGENILISLIVFVQNAQALRRDSLNRVRVPICISRRALEERFGEERVPTLAVSGGDGLS